MVSVTRHIDIDSAYQLSAISVFDVGVPLIFINFFNWKQIGHDIHNQKILKIDESVCFSFKSNISIHIYDNLFKTAHSHNLNQITVLLKSVYKHAVFNIQN